MVEEEPDVFAFRHALTREAIAGRLLGRERRRLHEKALAAIQEAGGDDWAAVAWHAQGAGRYDELVEAARGGAKSYLQQGSTAEALRLAETGLSEADRDLDLLAAASKAAWMIGLLSLAIEHGERWHAEAAAGGDPVLEAAALIHLGRLYWEARDFQRQWQTVRAALAVAEPLGESETLARAYSPGRRGPHAERPARRGRSSGPTRRWPWPTRSAAPAVRAAALVNKGTALADTEDGHDQGVALLEQAIAEADAGDFGYVLHRGLHNLLMQQVDTWPPERSRRVLQRMRETGERTGRGSEAPSWAMSRSEIAVVEGDLEAALTAIREARRSQVVPVEGWIDPWWIDLHEASLLLEAGELEPAAAFLERRQGTVPTAPTLRRRLAVGRPAGDGGPARRPGGDAGRPGRLPVGPAWKSWSWRHGTLGVHGLIAAAAGRLPPAEVRPLLEAIDREGRADGPGGPGARAGPAASTSRPPCWRRAATRRPRSTPTSRCWPTPTSTGPPTAWPTATRAPPAACWPWATSPAPSTTPARPAACSSAGRAGAATRPPPSCAASATARPRPAARPP